MAKKEYQPMTYTLVVFPEYYDLIDRGLKTIDIRIGNQKIPQIRVNDRIIWKCKGADAQRESVVHEINRYQSFEHLLEKHSGDLHLIAGRCLGAKEILRVLREIFGHQDRQKLAYAICFQLF